MKKMGSKIKNFVAGTAIALASFLPMKAEGQVNPAGLFVPTNENGIELLNKHNKERRDDLVQIVLNGDWVSEVPPTNPSDIYDWDCTNYTRQLLTNNWNWGEDIILYDGYAGDPVQDSLYIHGGTRRDMGKEGQPFMWVSIPNGEGHDMNAILTGDDATKWEDWNFVEPQFDQMNVQPGQAYMPENCEVEIKYPYVNRGSSGSHIALMNVATFQITNGNPELTYVNTEFITQRDKDCPGINRNSPLENEIYNTNAIPLEVNVEDANFKNAKYSVDNGKTWTSLNQSGITNLNLQNGDYKLLIEAEDYFYNKTRDSVNFSVNRPNDLEKEVLNSSLKVYPNPATDYLNFESEKNLPASLEIYSIDGKKVIEDYFENGNSNVDVSSLKPGVYIYNYENSEEVKTEKIVVR